MAVFVCAVAVVMFLAVVAGVVEDSEAAMSHYPGCGVTYNEPGATPPNFGNFSNPGTVSDQTALHFDIQACWTLGKLTDQIMALRTASDGGTSLQHFYINRSGSGPDATGTACTVGAFITCKPAEIAWDIRQDVDASRQHLADLKADLADVKADVGAVETLLGDLKAQQQVADGEGVATSAELLLAIRDALDGGISVDPASTQDVRLAGFAGDGEAVVNDWNASFWLLVGVVVAALGAFFLVRNVLPR